MNAVREWLADVYDMLDKNNSGFSLFMDFRKGFDVVNHRILLMKLDHYGIRGIILEWLIST